MKKIRTPFLYTLLKLAGIKSSLDKAFDTGDFGRHIPSKPPGRTRSGLQWDIFETCGRNVFILRPKRPTGRGSILYLHGGAYVFGFHASHWRFLETLVKATGYTVVAPDYPLAPEHTFRDAFDMVKPLCRDLCSSGAYLILMGDSAGGGFALALAQEMRREATGKAKKIILLCPWLDLTLQNPEIAAIAPDDPILAVSGLQRAGRAYAGDTDPANRLLSPINGEIEGLGEISVLIGTRDLLVADTRRFKRLSDEKGVKLQYKEYEDMVHNWMFFCLPGTRKAVRHVIDIINATES